MDKLTVKISPSFTAGIQIQVDLNQSAGQDFIDLLITSTWLNEESLQKVSAIEFRQIIKELTELQEKQNEVEEKDKRLDAVEHTLAKIVQNNMIPITAENKMLLDKFLDQKQ